MAKKSLAKRPASGVRTRTRVVQVVKRGARRAGSLAVKAKSQIAVAAGGGLLGALESRGVALPTVGGVDPALLWGAALAFGFPMVVKGEMGALGSLAGAGVLSVGAYRAISGMAATAGDDDAEDDYGG